MGVASSYQNLTHAVLTTVSRVHCPELSGASKEKGPKARALSRRSCPLTLKLYRAELGTILATKFSSISNHPPQHTTLIRIQKSCVEVYFSSANIGNVFTFAITGSGFVLSTAMAVELTSRKQRYVPSSRLVFTRFVAPLHDDFFSNLMALGRAGRGMTVPSRLLSIVICCSFSRLSSMLRTVLLTLFTIKLFKISLVSNRSSDSGHRKPSIHCLFITRRS